MKEKGYWGQIVLEEYLDAISRTSKMMMMTVMRGNSGPIEAATVKSGNGRKQCVVDSVES